jgi:uroporphyrinogen decarboxylase
MNAKELFVTMAKREMPERIPFVPTIYEHSARVISKTPSQVAQDEDLIVESQLASYEIYKHDLISVGLDIYNIEQEALGAKVIYHNNEKIPSVEEYLVQSKEDLDRLKMPDPEKSGRMPLFLNAVNRINKMVGNEVIVNGTIIGPFTLAARLRGFEDYLMDLMFEPEFAMELLAFSKNVGLTFAEAFIKRGVGISINESWIAPPLLSPNLYNQYIVETQRQMIHQINELGQKNVALISGGNTMDIAEDMVSTGTSMLMADYCTDHLRYKEICKRNNISLRASIESVVLDIGSREQIVEQCEKVIGNCADYEKFIFGCGVVSYGTEIKQLLELKDIVLEIGCRLRGHYFNQP